MNQFIWNIFKAAFFSALAVCLLVCLLFLIAILGPVWADDRVVYKPNTWGEAVATDADSGERTVIKPNIWHEDEGWQGGKRVFVGKQTIWNEYEVRTLDQY